MFRQTTPQLPLFEASRMVPDILPKDDWCYIYRDKIYPFIDENKFRHLYAEKGGAPNKSIKTQVSILIFMSIEKLNWRQPEFQFPRRIDWMVATQTEFGNASIDHTTLFKFYQCLENDKSAYKLFRDLTDAFIKECDVSLRKQRVDSFLCSVGSRYYLVMVYLRKQKEMAKDLYLLKTTFENHKQIKHSESFKTLVQVFKQPCIVKEQVLAKDKRSDEVLVEVELREKPEGEKIISSPHNTDAEYTRKRDQKVTGHRGFVVDGTTIIESEKNGINLAGPSSGRSQSIENFEEKNRPLDITDYEVKIDDETKEITVLSCPNRQEPLDQKRRDKGRILVHFDRNVCIQCPLQDRCPEKVGAQVSTLKVDEEQYAGASRHHQYVSDPEYRKESCKNATPEAFQFSLMQL